MNFHGVLFDKDGTLLDFNRTWLPIYRVAAAEFAAGDADLAKALLTAHGYDPERNRFAGGSLLAAGNNRQIAAAWATQCGRDIEVDALAERLNVIFREQGTHAATPVAGLGATLATLKSAGLRLGVATADSEAGIENTLQQFDVLHFFEFLAGYDSGHGTKPGPGIVLAFCRALGTDPARVIMVGDNRHDIEMGRNAGAGLCIGVLTGTSTRAELETLADLVLDDIGALPQSI